MSTDTKTKAEDTKAAAASAIDIDAIKAQIKTEILTDMKIQAAASAASAPSPVHVNEIDPNTDKVDFLAFKDNDKYKDDITVCVNGRSFRIQRGKRVKIPRYVAAVLENSQDQDTRTANLIESEVEAYNVASKTMG